jgi:hypothetical protein
MFTIFNGIQLLPNYHIFLHFTLILVILYADSMCLKGKGKVVTVLLTEHRAMNVYWEVEV